VKLEELEDLYELSATQQGMLFHELYHPDEGVYISQLACRLRGDLNLRAFGGALQILVDRHPALRTSLHWKELDKPLQMVHRRGSARCEELDWRGLSPAAQAEQLDDILRRERARGMPLDEPPLLRTVIIRLADDLYQLVWTYHHIIIDGWSATLLVRELFLFYEAARQGRQPYPPPATPFRDYVAWHQQHDFARDEAYWRALLSGFTELTPLPLERRAEDSSVRKEPIVVRRELSSAASERIAGLARRVQITDSTFAQAVWALLLARYSGRSDVVFGVATSGRTIDVPGAENIVGLLIGTLPMRLEVPPEKRAEAWLRDAQRRQADFRQHESTPLVEVQGWSEMPAGSPLFESILVFQNVPRASELSDPRLSFRVEDIAFYNRTNYPLTLMVHPGSRWEVELTCAPGHVEPALAEQLLVHYAGLLEAVARQPEARLCDLPLLSTEQRNEVVCRWNRTGREYPRERCWHELFGQAAQSSGGKVALRCKEAQLTFAELDRRSNRLARYFRKAGVGPDVRVGVCTDRSIDMVVAILGIHKAGGAYVPLDPAYPGERLALMLEDSQASVLVTTSQQDAMLPPREACTVLLDREQQAIARESDEPLPQHAVPENLAYVIYTSGSTGRPKGVMISHRALLNFLLSMSRCPGVEAHDRLLAVTSLSFDIHALELYAPLIRGAEINVVPRETAVDGHALARLVDHWDATVIQATPATWRLLIDSGWQGKPDLKVLCGGEALPPDLADQLLDRVAELWNMYGPTETTVWSTVQRVERDRPLTIGGPIANTQVYILDARLEPVPVGVAGELYIGGHSIARGYWRRPDLSAERFIADPFSTEAGARMYRTGDLCRWRRDGQVEFLGRADDQVKVRGFRIELGEIESVLSHHPAVRRAAVTAERHGAGSSRLIGYVVAERSDADLAAQLKQFVGARLPDYMVPSAFVLLDEMPLTPNGKINRKALPAPDASRDDLASQYVPPRNDLEEQLAEIWSSVLGLERVGIHDNFFELGGHSLLATQVIARLRSVSDAEVPLRELFQNPTIAQLSEAVEGAGSGTAQGALEKVDRSGELPLSFGQERLWLLDQLMPGSAAYNMPAVVRMVGPLDAEAFRGAIGDIVRRHEVLRTRVESHDGRPRPVIDAEATIELPLEDLAEVPAEARGERIAERAEEQASRPFDLATGPLLRGEILRLGEREHIVLLTLHHIVGDGWSTGVLIRELAEFYRARLTESEAMLPELPVQYADYAHWQRQQLAGEALEQHVEYWKRQLADIPALELPTDRPRREAALRRGGSVHFDLSPEWTRSLASVSRQAESTVFTTLLAAFQVLLSRYARTQDVAVGVPVAGRTRPEFEPLVGFFVNTLVMRTSLADRPTFQQLLERVQQIALDAQAHQDVPFEKLVEVIQPGRDLTRSPLFQVMFALQNTPLPEFELPGGLQFEALPPEPRYAKFDLSLSMRESGDRLVGTWEYDADLFDAATIERKSPRTLRSRSTMCRSSRRKSGKRWFAIGTGPKLRTRALRTSWRGSRRRRSELPGRRPFASVKRACRSPSSSRKRISLRGISASGVSNARCASGYAWSGRRSSSSACSAFSRRAGRMFRSIPDIRPSASS